MVSLRNIELKTISKVVTSDTSQITIGGQVPSGMRRWVTFIAIDSAGVGAVSDVGVYLASVNTSQPTKASITATSNRKLFVGLEGTQLSQSNKPRPLMIPEDGPCVDKPLFSIAGGYFLGVYASKTTANLFIQYFDE